MLLREWLPALAAMIGAKEPGKVPRAAVRLFGGDWGVTFLTELRGADNTRARDELGWRPGHPSWREGFRVELAAG